MKNLAIVLGLMLFCVLGCKHANEKTETEPTAEIATSSTSEAINLKLNNGEKWQANLETQEGIEKMDAIIKDFKSSENTDYKMLGTKLSEQTDFIIKKCSMKGEAHDELHVVLLPMLEAISVLKESVDKVAAKKALMHLEQLVAAYFKYFKV